MTPEQRSYRWSRGSSRRAATASLTTSSGFEPPPPLFALHFLCAWCFTISFTLKNLASGSGKIFSTLQLVPVPLECGVARQACLGGHPVNCLAGVSSCDCPHTCSSVSHDFFLSTPVALSHTILVSRDRPGIDPSGARVPGNLAGCAPGSAYRFFSYRGSLDEANPSTLTPDPKLLNPNPLPLTSKPETLDPAPHTLNPKL